MTSVQASPVSATYQFSIDNLKIDRCFVTAMSENEGDEGGSWWPCARSPSQCRCGRHRGTRANHRAESLGCHLGQGYVFAKPMALGACANTSSRSLIGGLANEHHSIRRSSLKARRNFLLTLSGSWRRSSFALASLDQVVVRSKRSPSDAVVVTP